MAGILGTSLGGFGSAALGTAVVSVGLDTRQLTTGMASARKQVDSGTTGMEKNAALMSAAFITASTLAGVAVLKFAADSIRAASDQGEALNKANVVFEESADKVVAFANTSAESFGISKTAALDSAAAFGSMLQTAGMTADAAADMSTELVGLAADMASFNNQDPSEMLERLRSGLAGEAEPLRRFGVFLSEAAVKAQAYKDGIAKVGSELTEAQKVQARYNLIMEQTVKQQGDFGRTLGTSMPNQMRQLRAEFEDISAEVGKDLLPIMTDLLGVVKDLLPIFGVLAENLELVVLALAGFAAVKYLPGLLTGIAEGLAKIGAVEAGVKVLAAQEALTGLGAAAAGAAAPIAALAAGVAIGAAADHYYTSEVDKMRGALDGLSVTMMGTGQAVAYNAAGQEILRGSIDSINQTLQTSAGAHEELGAKASLGAAAIADAALASGDLGRAAGKAADAVVRFGMTAKDFKDWKESVADGIRDTVGNLDGLRNTWDITANEAIRDMRSMAKQAREMAADYKALDKEAIPEGFRQWLLEQGPAAVHAFISANTKGKAEMVKLWREIDRNTEAALDNMAAAANSAGANVMGGLAQGLTSHAGQVYVAIESIAENMMNRLNAKLGIRSPSEEAKKSGRQFMLGLAEGLRSEEDEVLAEAEAIAEKLTRALERKLEEATDRLSRVMGKAGDLRSAISGGFSSFLDISGAFGLSSGTDISQFFALQAADAAKWAATLQQLQGMGLSSALLQQIAQAGPEAMGFAQGLLQMAPEQISALNAQYASISDLAGETAKGLSEDYFGEKIDELKDEVKLLNQAIRALDKPRRIELTFKPGGEHALRQLILQVISEVGAMRGGL